MIIEIISTDKKTDITQLTTSISWSGSTQTAGRKLEVSILQSNKDYFLPKLKIELGSMLRFINNDGAEIFQGYIFFKNISSSSEEIKITAYDGLIYLTKSKISKNFSNLTPGAILKQICLDFNIPIGNIKDINSKVSMIALKKSPYEVITNAYNLKANTIKNEATGKEKTVKELNGESIYEYSKYFLKMENGKLNVYEKGTITASQTLHGEFNLNDADYSEDIEDMINCVLITDEQGNKIGEKKNDAWISKFGKLQDIAENADEAKKMIAGIKRAGNIDALGDLQCVTGNKVKVFDTKTEIIGIFTVESDTHTWNNGQHEMKLTLDFSEVLA